MKILLVDDHQMFLDGMKALLTESDVVTAIEVVNNGRDALRRLQTGGFDIALIDLRLPILDGFTLLEEMNKRNNLTPIIIVSASRDPHDIEKAIELGAMSFIPKSSSGQKIIQTIRDVLGGKVVYSNNATVSAIFSEESEEWAAQHHITQRQLEVLRLVRKGLSNQAIADQLSLSVPTVKTHISAIFNALGTQSRTESSKKSHQLGLD
ncbi:MAG: response regulator transcription factor [Thalassolituus sp.]|uniref:response regulator transcription factor n=1 Tax=Thalassolituus sp. TaxID=2030822 RepID=UPI00398276A8